MNLQIVILLLLLSTGAVLVAVGSGWIKLPSAKSTPRKKRREISEHVMAIEEFFLFEGESEAGLTCCRKIREELDGISTEKDQ